MSAHQYVPGDGYESSNYSSNYSFDDSASYQYSNDQSSQSYRIYDPDSPGDTGTEISINDSSSNNYSTDNSNIKNVTTSSGSDETSPYSSNSTSGYSSSSYSESSSSGFDPSSKENSVIGSVVSGKTVSSDSSSEHSSSGDSLAVQASEASKEKEEIAKGSGIYRFGTGTSTVLHSRAMGFTGTGTTGTGTLGSGLQDRRDFNPYFEIKSNVASILKDMTDWDNPYKPKTTTTYQGNNNNQPEQAVPQPVGPKVIPLSKQRDWNGEFQALLDKREKMEKNEKAIALEESIDVFERLSNLEKDFVYTATMYGRIIISEQYQQQKTFLPVNVGGVAGGTKYIVNGILFKFVKDDPKLKLYGSDEFAMKTASHEKNGLVSLYHCGISELRIPLMSYIDYRGHRLMAISILPINRSTLVYGSHDGGTEVHTDNPKFNELMKLAGQRLHLKQHIVGADKNGMGGKMIYGPADIEGHIGFDGRFYLLDFARLAPPEPVTSTSAPGSFLYKLLRLELVRQSMPLSSDAFSFIGRIDGPVHNAEVRSVFTNLLNYIIPKFAESLTESSLDNMEEFIYNLHSQGINVRQLGYLRAKCTEPVIKNKILGEAVSRVIKNQYRLLLREEMIVSGASDEPYRKLTVNFLNLVFGGVNMNFTTLYWNDVIKNDLHTKFKNILAPGEVIDLFGVCVGELGVTLVKRLGKVCGMKFKKQATVSIEQGINGFRFVDPDLKDLEVVVTRLNMIDYSDGMALFYKAKSMESQHEQASQLRLISMSRTRLRAARYSMCSTEEAIYYNAIAEQFVAKLQKKTTSPLERSNTLKAAEQAFDDLLKLETHIQHDIYLGKAKCIRARAKLRKDMTGDDEVSAEELFDLAITNIKLARDIEQSDISLYTLAKTLFYRYDILNNPPVDDLQESLELMEAVYLKDKTCAAFAYSFAQLLLHAHEKKLQAYMRRHQDTNEVVRTDETQEEIQEREAILKRVGELMETAVQLYPKLYVTKVLKKFDTSFPNDSIVLWSVWSWLRYSPLLVDAVLPRLTAMTEFKMCRCKFVDETVNVLTSHMPNLVRFDINDTTDAKNESPSNELASAIVAALPAKLVKLGLSGSLITTKVFLERKFDSLVSLDMTNCKQFDVTGLRLPQLRSIKLDGCITVTDKTLLQFLESTPLLVSLYLPSSISDEGTLEAAKKVPKLQTLRPTTKISERVLSLVLQNLPELTKLDLLGCELVQVPFADSVNKTCKNILKVRDAYGGIHPFTGLTSVKLTTKKVGINNSLMEVFLEGHSYKPVLRVDRVVPPTHQFPYKWVVRAFTDHELTHFRGLPLGTSKELYNVSRIINLATTKFTVSNQPAVKVEFFGGTNHFPSNSIELNGQEVTLEGIVMPNLMYTVTIKSKNEHQEPIPIARIRQNGEHSCWIDLLVHSLNMSMLMTCLIIVTNKLAK